MSPDKFAVFYNTTTAKKPEGSLTLGVGKMAIRMSEALAPNTPASVYLFTGDMTTPHMVTTLDVISGSVPPINVSLLLANFCSEFSV